MAVLCSRTPFRIPFVGTGFHQGASSPTGLRRMNISPVPYFSLTGKKQETESALYDRRVHAAGILSSGPLSSGKVLRRKELPEGSSLVDVDLLLHFCNRRFGKHRHIKVGEVGLRYHGSLRLISRMKKLDELLSKVTEVLFH